MLLPAQITLCQHAGYAALHLKTRHGSVTLALHGAHLLSWVPAGQRDVLWLSPQPMPEPAAIRGGVPVCWPWFAKQGMPDGASQHGPARLARWQISAIHTSNNDEVSLSLTPCPPSETQKTAFPLIPGLEVSLRVTLNASLTQTLQTRNVGVHPFLLTQALHSYFAVANASLVTIEGLAGLPYQDKLRGMCADVQQTPFAFELACDRIYHHADDRKTPLTGHRYTLNDPAWKRRIVIDTEGSDSVVVWNPGSEGARGMADLPDDCWQAFFCIEAANAGPDVITLAAGAEHSLSQTLTVLT